MLRDQYYLKPFFLNALPLNTEPNAVTEMQRFRTLTTEHVALMLPVISDWKGTGTPSLLNFVTRNGQLVNMDLFDSPSNYNLVISAQSGSGKSFLTNEIILSYLAEGAKVWVIDIGRSYKKLCDVVGGEFIAFN
ncbi:TraG/VirB4 family ATPase, partial [Leclercia adecarboxylata]|nr:type IV secretion system protein TraC [Leclercia adecarboxylata]